MSQLEKQERPSALDITSIVTDLEVAETAAEIATIVARAEALVEVAKKARLADDQLQKFSAVALRAQRRGGDILNNTPRAIGRNTKGFPSLAMLMELPPSTAKHLAEDWLAVASVPEPLFEEYLTLPDHVPTRAGLLRYKQVRPKRPPGRPRSKPPEAYEDAEPPPAPTRLKIVPQDDSEPVAGHPALLSAQAEAWNQCVAWFAQQTQPRIPDHLLQEAEQSNPYDL